MTQAIYERAPSSSALAGADDDTTTTGTIATAPAWEQAGIRLDQAKSGPDALRLAKLDWQVVQWPVAAVSPEGWGTVAAREFVANVRADTKDVLGIVNRKQQPFQNRDAFAFADSVVVGGGGGGQGGYEAAGLLRGGRRVWVLLRLGSQPVLAGPGDEVRPYLLLSHAHDDSAAAGLRAVLIGVRDVCANSLNLALSGARGGGGIVIRRCGDDPQVRAADARRALDLVQRRFAAFGREIEVLRSVPMSNGRLHRYFDTLLPPLALGPDAGDRERDNRLRSLDRLNANFEDELNTLPGMRGTLWAALNAATEFADHQRKVRGATDLARCENRLDSIWFGSANDFKQAAYRSALELAGLN